MEANGRDTGVAVIDQQRQGVALLCQGGRGVDQVVAVVAQSLDSTAMTNWIRLRTEVPIP